MGKILIAGARGMVGSAITRAVRKRDDRAEIVGFWKTSDVDYRDRRACEAIFERGDVDLVFCVAARVGGIGRNVREPADMIRDNALIAINLLDAAARAKPQPRRFVYLGSTCVYPPAAPLPLAEASLLDGPPHPTNFGYADAKRLGIEACRAYRIQHGLDAIALQPTNLYGPGDRYEPVEDAHVIPAMIAKAHRALTHGLPSLDLWGTGRPRRDFLHVDDLAEAAMIAVESSFRKEWGGLVNVASGVEVSIADVAEIVCDAVQYHGPIRWSGDLDGVDRKPVDCSRIRALGWEPKIDLGPGVRGAYDDFVDRLKESGRHR